VTDGTKQTCRDCVHLYRIQTGHGYEPEVQVPRCSKARQALYEGVVLVPSNIRRCQKFFEPMDTD
jgi:hypothetical protein